MKKRITGGKIISFAFYSLIIIMLVAIALTTLSGNQEKNGVTLGPYNLFIVLSGSMSPTFEAGSIVITQETAADKYREGDILTYKPLDNNTLVTHRIVNVIYNNGSYSYITRGDANNVNDASQVLYEDVVGRVIFWMNGVGAALLYIRTPRGIAFAVIIIALLAFLSFLVGKLKTCISQGNEEA